MAKLSILMGADPEIFVRRKDKKFYTSAHGMVEGNKDQPHKVDKGAVQVDGMALEFNIDPAANKEEFIDNLNSVMGTLRGMVSDKYELDAVPTAKFHGNHMKVQPQEALELGCEPDFNAWENGAANPTPDGGKNFRTGAGHIHIGWTEGADINDPNHLDACMWIVKQLDCYLGLGSLLFDDDNKRREMYGKAGAFRPKSYGVEYRVLSNAWLKSDKLKAWVYDTTQKAIDDAMAGKYRWLVYKSARGVIDGHHGVPRGWIKRILWDWDVELPEV